MARVEALDRDPANGLDRRLDGGEARLDPGGVPRAIRIASLTLGAPALPVRRPTRSSLVARWFDAAVTGVGRGLVVLPRAVRTRELRIDGPARDRAASATAAEARRRDRRDLRPAVRARAARTTFTAPCGSARVRSAARRSCCGWTARRPRSSAGRRCRRGACGAPVTLRSGVTRLSVAAGPLAVDELRLSSPAPAPRGRSRRGAVLDRGTAGRGSYSHVRVSVFAPSWLVLGESYDRGWEALCNGRSLGAPVPIDGYANGWRVGAGCRNVRFTFAPNRLALIGYLRPGSPDRCACC